MGGLPQKKRPKMSNTHVQFGSKGFDKLTRKQRLIAELFYNQFQTIKDISLRLGMSESSIYKIIERLKKKGKKPDRFFNKIRGGIGSNVKTSNLADSFINELNSKKLRLHRVELNINFLEKSEGFYKVVGKIFSLRGDTLRVFKDSVEVYLNRDFWGLSTDECNAELLSYLDSFIPLLESDLGVKVSKDRKQNVRVVRSEYSEVNNELAKDLESRGEKLRIRGKDDKIWLEVDNSLNLRELETKHPLTSKEDMDLVKGFFDDIRSHPELPRLSELIRIVYFIGQESKATTQQLREVSTGLNIVVKLLTPKENKENTEEGEPVVAPEYIG